jgi:ABC-type sugar transport system substrate-binding protein
MMRSLKKKAALAAATTLAAVGLMTVIATPASAAPLPLYVGTSPKDSLSAWAYAIAQCPTLDNYEPISNYYRADTGLYYWVVTC